MFNGVREPNKKTYNVIKLKKGVGRDTATAEAPISTYKRVNGLQKSDESHRLSLIPG